MFEVLPNLTHSSSICIANSFGSRNLFGLQFRVKLCRLGVQVGLPLVGARTRILGTPLFTVESLFNRRWNAGSKKPIVFPEPVFATVIISRPDNAIGHD